MFSRISAASFVVLTLCLLAGSPVGHAMQDKKDADTKKDKDKKDTKVTAAGFDFQLMSSKMNGQNWELLLGVVSPEANSDLSVLSAKAYTEDGKVYSATFRALSKEKIHVKLPVGQKVQVKVNMGFLPDTVKSLSTVQLQCTGKKKGAFAATFKDVPVER